MTGCSDRYIFKDVADRPESNESSPGPSLALYENTDAARSAYMDGPSETQNDTESHTTKPDSTRAARVAWAWTSLLVEMNRKPFRSSKVAHNRATTAQLDAINTHIAQVLHYQHREFCFTVYITRTHARLIRSDRRGTIVSTPIKLAEDPAVLLNFVARYVRMSPVQQGYDPTAKLASSDAIEALRQRVAIPPGEERCLPEYVRKSLMDTFDNQRLHPIYEVCSFDCMLPLLVAHVCFLV